MAETLQSWLWWGGSGSSLCQQLLLPCPFSMPREQSPVPLSRGTSCASRPMSRTGTPTRGRRASPTRPYLSPSVHECECVSKRREKDVEDDMRFSSESCRFCFPRGGRRNTRLKRERLARLSRTNFAFSILSSPKKKKTRAAKNDRPSRSGTPHCDTPRQGRKSSDLERLGNELVCSGVRRRSARVVGL